MLTITRKTDYALIALAHLAQKKKGALCSSREISEQYHLPAALMGNVLKALVQAELVRSTRGIKGGYALALPPQRVTLGSVIRAMEGPIRLVQCSDEHVTKNGCCELMSYCPVTKTVQKVHRQLMEFLNKVTLAQIAFDGDCPDCCVSLSREGAALSLE